MFEQVTRDYERLEPAGADTWSPLEKEKELCHRLRLAWALREGIRRTALDVATARFLDVGCGVGRSTRMLVELGADPTRVAGVDIRSDALETARHKNPAIAFTHWDPTATPSWPGPIDFCLQCTVFSSIRDRAERAWLGARMVECIRPGGWLFWWDSCVAHPNAGRDPLRPRDYFPGAREVWSTTVPTRPTLAEALRIDLQRWPGSALLQRFAGHAATHCASLLQVS